MCLIIVAPKGTDKYSDLINNSIDNGAFTNDDGFGYAFKDNNSKRVFISKGYFDVEKLKDSIKSKNLSKDDELIIHFRIGTSGEKNARNCHPFVVSERDDDIQSLEGYLDVPVLAHNGVFYKYSYQHSLFSDTYHFTKEFIAIPEVLQLLKRNNKLFESVFSEKLSTNKLALLFPDIDLITIGNYIEDGGYLFSNSCYKNSSIRNIGGKEVSYKKYGSRYYNEYDDYYDGYGDNREFDPKPSKKEELSSENSFVGRPLLKNITITEDNYDELSLICKESTTSFTKGKEYHLDIVFRDDQFISIYEMGDKFGRTLQNRSTIEDNFNIVPKREFENKYRTYNYLLSNLNLSRNSLKKLRRVLSNNYNNTQFSFKGKELSTSGAALFLKNYEYKLDRTSNKEKKAIIVD